MHAEIPHKQVPLKKQTLASKLVYARKLRRYSSNHLTQMSIIFVFILVSTLISILLPIYIAHLPLAGF